MREYTYLIRLRAILRWEIIDLRLITISLDPVYIKLRQVDHT